MMVVSDFTVRFFAKKKAFVAGWTCSSAMMVQAYRKADVASGHRRWKGVILDAKERREDICLYVTGFFPQKCCNFCCLLVFVGVG